MGDGFSGHSASGLAFLLLGSWLSWGTARQWWRSRGGGGQFQSVVSHQDGWRRPWESWAKILVVLAYAMGEFLTGYWATYSFVKHGQHITMCGFFILNGLTDLLLFHRVPVPPQLQHLTASLAFWAESFLFSNHSHGMSGTNMTIHHLLYLPSYTAAGLLLLEAALPGLWLLSAMRNLAICLHGSWLVQAAFILYPERLGLQVWEEDSTMMFLPMLFSWHLLANLLLQGFWLLVTSRSEEAAKEKYTYSRLLEATSDCEEEEVEESGNA